MARKVLAILAFGLILAAANVAHATVLYTWSGVIPNGATVTHPSVGVGETWMVTTVVDDTVADSQLADPSVGLYVGAALSTTLSFSGGFSTSSFGLGTVVVFDDWIFPVDAVQASSFSGPDLLIVQTATELVGTLSSDALPLAGTTFSAFPDPSIPLYFNLTYSGSEGTVSYYGDTANNSAFSAVPEPATLTSMGIGLLALGFLRRRRQG